MILSLRLMSFGVTSENGRVVILQAGWFSFQNYPMRFDPFSRTLYTSSGRKIKRLSCPYHLGAEDLDPEERCSKCDRIILDAHSLGDEALADLLDRQPDTCLKVDLDHPDIRIGHEPI